jgi:hypothetical protein
MTFLCRQLHSLMLIFSATFESRRLGVKVPGVNKSGIRWCGVYGVYDNFPPIPDLFTPVIFTPSRRVTEQYLCCSRSRPLRILHPYESFDNDKYTPSGSRLLVGLLRALRNSKPRGSKRCTSLIWYYNDLGPEDRGSPRNFLLCNDSLSFFEDPRDN